MTDVPFPLCSRYQLLTSHNCNSQLTYLRTKSKSKSKLCYDQWLVGQSVLVSSTHLGLKTRLLLLSDSCGFVDVGHSLWRKNGSATYNCCWSSPAQSFLDPSLSALVTIFYCLRFETPPTWRARSPYLYPPGTGWPSYTPRHSVPFLSPPTTCRSMVEIFQVRVRVMLQPMLQSASPSWNKAHIWGLTPNLYYCQTVAGLLIWGALSDDRQTELLVLII
jgi:hypothetical protein